MIHSLYVLYSLYLKIHLKYSFEGINASRLSMGHERGPGDPKGTKESLCCPYHFSFNNPCVCEEGGVVAAGHHPLSSSPQSSNLFAQIFLKMADKWSSPGAPLPSGTLSSMGSAQQEMMSLGSCCPTPWGALVLFFPSSDASLGLQISIRFHLNLSLSLSLSLYLSTSPFYVTQHHS